GAQIRRYVSLDRAGTLPFGQFATEPFHRQIAAVLFSRVPDLLGELRGGRRNDEVLRADAVVGPVGAKQAERRGHKRGAQESSFHAQGPSVDRVFAAAGSFQPPAGFTRGHSRGTQTASQNLLPQPRPTFAASQTAWCVCLTTSAAAGLVPE